MNNDTIKLNNDTIELKISNVQKCLPIEIEVGNYDDLLKLVKEKQHPECKEKDWVIVHSDGKLIYNTDYLTENKIWRINCSYNVIKLNTDYDFKLEKAIPFTNNQSLDPNEEFFKINCDCIAANTTYQGFHARILQPKIKATKPSRKPINVFLLGLDSVSREKWLNGLPKSSRFLLHKMDALLLKGYNILGDGTPNALIPMLTGRQEWELPKTLKSDNDSIFCDLAYPFIWRNFTDRLNYATMFNEDWALSGTLIFLAQPFNSLTI